MPDLRAQNAPPRALILAGRFQPYHLGHHDLVRHCLSISSIPVLVGILISSIPLDFPPPQGELSREAEPRHLRENNPFSYWQRREMIEGAWPEERKRGDLIVSPLPRPQGPPEWWTYVREFLPEYRTWAVPETGDRFDEHKVDFFLSVGEEVLRIPSKCSASGSEIRRQWRNGARQSALAHVPAATRHVMMRDWTE